MLSRKNPFFRAEAGTSYRKMRRRFARARLAWAAPMQCRRRRCRCAPQLPPPALGNRGIHRGSIDQYGLEKGYRSRVQPAAALKPTSFNKKIGHGSVASGASEWQAWHLKRETRKDDLPEPVRPTIPNRSPLAISRLTCHDAPRFTLKHIGSKHQARPRRSI